ncbi:MAG: hypothetical protein DRJ56_07225, partial [Thermoprotei archaeon]
MSVFFENITLALGDYIEVYDEQMNLLSRYEGPISLTDVWATWADGDEIYIRFVSDGEFESWGFKATLVGYTTTYDETILDVDELVRYVNDFSGVVLITGENLSMVPDVRYYGVPYGYNYYVMPFEMEWVDVAQGGASKNFITHPLTRGVSTIFFGNPYSSLKITGPHAFTLAWDPYFTGIGIYYNETSGGAFIAIADDQVLNNEFLYSADNLRLGLNIMAWAGDWDTAVFDEVKVVPRHSLGFEASYSYWTYNATEFPIDVTVKNFGNYTEDVWLWLEYSEDLTQVAPGKASLEVEPVSPSLRDLIMARLSTKTLNWTFESDHPYTANWYAEIRLDTDSMMRRFHIANITLEAGDVLKIVDAATGFEWTWTENATDIWTPWFPDGVQYVYIIDADFDDRWAGTRYGLVIDMYEVGIQTPHPYPETDVVAWVLESLHPYIEEEDIDWVLESLHPYLETKVIDCVTVETPHPYGPGMDEWYNITHPGAAAIKLHFEYIDIGPGDYLEIYDGEWRLVATYTEGYWADVWTPWIDGYRVYLHFVSDASGQAEGFVVDKYELICESDVVSWLFESQHPYRERPWGSWSYESPHPYPEMTFVDWAFESVHPYTEFSVIDWVMESPHPYPEVINVSYVVESDHPYASNANETWTITQPDAVRMRVHFERIEVETCYDFVYVYDADWNLIASYTGNLTDVWTDWIEGDTVYIRLTSDRDVEWWGFKIDGYQYMAVRTISYVVESDHPYGNDLNMTYTITDPGAEAIRVHFENITLERCHDYIYVYDADWNLVAWYTGTHTDVWTPWVDGETIYVRLVTDSSGTAWGFRIDKYQVKPAEWVKRVAIYTGGEPIRIRIYNLTLEEGDVLTITDLVTGVTYAFTHNLTKTWWPTTDWFWPDADGYVRLLFRITTDLDTKAAWGLEIDKFMYVDEWTAEASIYTGGRVIRLHIANLTLEAGDELGIYDYTTGAWQWFDTNTTDLWTGMFFPDEAGYVNLRFWIRTDLDNATAWGLKIDKYESLLLQAFDLTPAFESDHPYSEGMLSATAYAYSYDTGYVYTDVEHTITHPGADAIRVHFTVIDIYWADALYIYDKDYNLIQAWYWWE